MEAGETVKLPMPGAGVVGVIGGGVAVPGLGAELAGAPVGVGVGEVLDAVGPVAGPDEGVGAPGDVLTSGVAADGSLEANGRSAAGWPLLA